jgi:hypothetical protein
LVVLVVVSLVGDRLCRSAASGVNQEEQLRIASEAVGKIPESFGRWRMTASEPVDDDVVRMLQCRAHQSRVYVDDETGEKLSFILFVGPPGPLVAHTPDICYSSAAFEIAENTESEVVRGEGNQADTFNRIEFRSKSVSGEKQEVYYGWRRPAGHWEAPESPRLSLAGSPLLYKVQVASIDGAKPSSSTEDAEPVASVNRRFLADLLPVLDSILQNR